MYPELATLINQHLKPEFKQKFQHIKTQCLVPNVAEFLYQDVLAMFNDAEGMLDQPFVKDILRKNGLGLGTPKIPIFAYKGVQDELSVVGDSDKLIDTWCNNGAPSVMYYRDLTGFHGTTAVTGVGRSLDFLHSVFNGEKQASGCKRQDVFSGLADLKGSKYLPGFLFEFILDLLGKPVGPLIG